VSRRDYYGKVKLVAQHLRDEYGFATPRVLRSDLRRIYGAEGIRIDLREGLRKLRGAYFYDAEIGSSVLLQRGLPTEPLIFTMGHELKHHFCDRSEDDTLVSLCSDANVSEAIEIGAEIFAAELIYPDDDFCEELDKRKIGRGQCDAAAIVRLKHDTATTLSYASLAKRATLFGYARDGALEQVRWHRLEQEMYGEPLYKRLLRRRGAIR